MFLYAMTSAVVYGDSETQRECAVSWSKAVITTNGSRACFSKVPKLFGRFRVPQFPLYLRNAIKLSNPLSFSYKKKKQKHAKRSALRIRTVLGTFEKQAPDIRYIEITSWKARAYGIFIRVGEVSEIERVSAANE